jgi:hypothetical protein
MMAILCFVGHLLATADSAAAAVEVAAGDACDGGCPQKVVRRVSLGDRVLQVRTAETRYGTLHAIVIGSGDRWEAEAVGYLAYEDDCGAGSCASSEVRRIRVHHHVEDGGVTVSFQLRTRVDHPEEGTSERHRSVVLVACDLDFDTRCARVGAGDLWNDGAILVEHREITIRDGQTRRTDTIPAIRRDPDVREHCLWARNPKAAAS